MRIATLTGKMQVAESQVLRLCDSIKTTEFLISETERVFDRTQSATVEEELKMLRGYLKAEKRILANVQKMIANHLQDLE